MIVLAVESSCDETSVSISKDGKEILSNIVLSQIDIHKDYGGVVPEIASREHVKGVTYCFDKALKEAKIKPEEVDLVAVTEGPGLIGSLLTGINAAKVFALNYDKPIIGVHHIDGHIYANNIEHDIKFPCLALVVSGGHTELILMKEHYNFIRLGSTLDDAVGESYDKVARVLHLTYPGGPMVDKMATEGKDIYHFPRALIDSNDYNFSFSGLKSAVINKIHNFDQTNTPFDPKDIAASFQECVTDILVSKTKRAQKEYGVDQIIVAGGSAANSGLRKKIREEIKDVEICFPSLKYCGDNAAMIGIAGYFAYKAGRKPKDMSLNGDSRLELI